MRAPLRWGVIGLGRAGLAKLNSISALGSDRAELSAIATRRPLPELLQERYPALRSLSWEALVSDPEIDAVAICSENELHATQARASLSAGKHTLVDFPLCQSATEFEALHLLAQQKEVVLHQELIGLLSPSHTLLQAQLRQSDPIASISIHFTGGLSGWVRREVDAGRWALLALGRLQRAWSLIGPLSLTGAQLSVEGGGYTLQVSLAHQGGAQVRLCEARHPSSRRSTQIEVYTQSERGLHEALPSVLPKPSVPLFTQDLIHFHQRVATRDTPAPHLHYVPYSAQLGVMRLIDAMTTQLHTQR